MGQNIKKLGKKYVLPFFLVLAVMTVLSLAVPLRPSFSYSEKRELEKFPAFTVESLLSGDYFDGISPKMYHFNPEVVTEHILFTRL